MHIGQILRNRYKITKTLASGGFGDTYLAEDIDLPNYPQCVVKHLKRNPNAKVLQIAKRLFESEAEVLYRLGNECSQIPKLFAHFEENGEFYLVQEFIDGQDLRREIYPGKQWSEAEVTQLLQEILEVFTVIHNKNIIHRDIKPANLMRRYKDGKIVVIDFGAVKEISTLTVNAQGQTIPSVAIGTVGYMPSEQASGQPKLCSDVYAIGMLGIYALTGVQPHELPKDPRNGEVIWRNWANISESMADVLTKMVRYNFSDRYQNAFDALDAIASVAAPPIYPKSQVQPNLLPRRKVIQNLQWMVAGLGLAYVGNTVFTAIKEKELRLQTFNFETVTVDARGNIINRRNLDAKYFAEDLGNGVTLEMVQIPGGTFMMGSTSREAESSFKNESPQRPVQLPGFFMGKYEITQAQYQAIMGNKPAYFIGDKRPVENVSRDDVVEFCKKLSQKTGRTYRLPSEAEWEYACRAGTTTPFYFGETITTDLVNYSYNGDYTYGSTTPVDSFPPNAFGLYDMHGNVWEWCEDTWHDNYIGAPSDGSAWINNDDSFFRVMRGGSWGQLLVKCRSASRSSYGSINVGDSIIGFRVVCSVSPKTSF